MIKRAPRPYQSECRDAIEAAFKLGICRQLIALPTAAGKTFISSSIPKMLNLGKEGLGQLVFIVPLDELVWQAQSDFMLANPSLTVGIVKAGYNDVHADVLIASAHTIGYMDDTGSCPRLSLINPNRVRAVLVDECDGSTAPMYQQIFRHLRVLKGDPNEDRSRLLVGVTATPNRTDGIGLEYLYEKIVYQISIMRLMTEGPVIDGEIYTYLAKPKVWRVSTNVDASQARVSKSGDFTDKSLSHILDSPERNELVVKSYIELGEGFPGATFACDVKHAYSLAEVYNHFGVNAAVIEGKTKRARRDEISEMFKAGHIRMITSCDAIAVGWNEPTATVGVMARPSKSARNTTQKVGRFFRRSPSPEQYLDMLERGQKPTWIKPYSIIIDCVDIMGKHNLSSVNSLFGLPPKYNCKGKIVTDAVKEVEAVIKKHAPANFKKAESLGELTAMAEVLDIFAVADVSEETKQFSKLAWLEIREGVYQLDIGRGAIEVREGTLGDVEVFEVRDGLRKLAGNKPTLAEGIRFADSMVPQQQLILLRTTSKWRSEPPTAPQCGLLWKWNKEARVKFKTSGDLYKFASDQFKLGDKRYGKGGISSMLDKLKLEKVGAA